ncbi:glycogen debranching protein GlgX [candidate division KSB1 bacterium]|nr:glycogen debranching protein GlgX [candidate division KSB1 bacterium]
MTKDIRPGKSFPLGATVLKNGVNFCIFSQKCEKIDLVLFDDVDAARPSRTIELDPKINKTFYYWHVFVPGIHSGQIYGYRAYGLYEPGKGHYFDHRKLLLDPYTRAVVKGKKYDRQAAIRPGDNFQYAMKSVVIDTTQYNWENDRPPKIPYSDSVIYEMHVGGFTRHPGSGIDEKKRGTFSGLIEKIPYLKTLGITAVELMPVQQFDEQDAPYGMENYWGYSPIAFFAPHRGYCFSTDSAAPVNEFRDMVKALHKAGIEVILDVVFNHTAEGNEKGPTICYRGLANHVYYMLDNKSRYANFSGCGNTLNGNHSIVRRLIRHCLRYWVSELHVDGFRFDLASVMARGEKGELLENPPILWSIDSDPVLAGTKIIAEAWDAAGLYQVGSFIGDRFAEWNGPFRDDIRKFAKGDEKTVIKLAARLNASPDIYGRKNREPNRSINFITCHDGFTLNDLVSYNEKHNEANKENNNDGHSENFSWNCGTEGSTVDLKINKLRLRQMKNMMTLLFISQGTPMILMGDELQRTQHGNNNAYCQNNKISWLNWDDVQNNQDMLRFVKLLIRFTQTHDIFREERFWIPSDKSEEPHITFHGTELFKPDWSDFSHSLAFTLNHPESGNTMHIACNAYWKKLTFQLPPLKKKRSWLKIVDTFADSPFDIQLPKDAPHVTSTAVTLESRSILLLYAK